MGFVRFRSRLIAAVFRLVVIVLAMMFGGGTVQFSSRFVMFGGLQIESPDHELTSLQLGEFATLNRLRGGGAPKVASETT